MQTIKTSIVVILLLAVLYGAYTVINQPPPKLPPEVAEMTTDMWDDEPAVAFSDGPGTDGIQPVFGSSLEQTQVPSAQPGLLLSESESSATPSPAPTTPQAAVTTPQPTATTPPSAEDNSNQQAAAMLAAPQPLSPVGTTPAGRASSPAGDLAAPTAQVGVQVAAPVGNSAPAVAVGQVAEAAMVNQANATSVEAVAPANASPVDTASAAPPAHPGVMLAKKFPADWAKSCNLLAERQYTEALRILSPHFGSLDLTPAESERLIAVLDPLAGRVIYSREHAVAPPHKIRRGETLYTIAEQYQVPWQLLRNINGVTNPEVLVPGTELKVVRGPFTAQVDVKRSELTLFTDGMYAGRFPISVGSDFAARAGDYQVQGKSTERAYYGPNNRVLPAGHPENPYGNAWLDLGGDLAIHGSPQSTARGTTAAGAISLSPRDATDVYGILSKGSTVTILR